MALKLMHSDFWHN